MFLKSLTLKGFKSFADTATLDLEPGVTVVVGPNGSGKSNVVDAIAWVLGAQAPSSVRSAKMDDVIFAGTQDRPALGRAEVSLTIDNADRTVDIDFTEVTITRTLFRTGDSEYAINGTPCRLLDIAELLSDTGVGRQQHVIVSQGQIDAVLNARPEDRRSIIEEAAGVLKYRKRKEKAERRLRSTEANLTRIQDLVREVRRQLRPLERQAEAARKHGAVLAELDGLRRFVAGRELVGLRDQREHQRSRRSQLGTENTEVTRELARLDTAVMAAESRLADVGGDDLVDLLSRQEALRERALGLSAVLVERRRGVERDRTAFVDQAVVASLESDAARLRAELDQVDAEGAELVPQAERLDTAQAALDAERAAFAQAWGDGVPAPDGRAAEARGELSALRSARDQRARERERLEQRRAELLERQARLDADRVVHQQAVADADSTEGPLVGQVDAAEAHLGEEAATLAAIESRLAAALSHHQATQARVEALELALDEARARAGAERLADVDGVLGTLLDLVEVDPGWETAFEAAAGEALRAVVVDGPDHASAAVRTLRQGELAGAVLALGVPTAPTRRPSVGDPVLDHVRARRSDLAPLLDALVGTATLVADVDRAIDTALAHPDLVVVTAEGDRLAVGGWRVGAAGTGATGAALDDARAAEATAAEAVASLEADARRAGAAREEAAVEHRRLVETLDALDETRAAAEAALHQCDNERQNLAVELEAVDLQLGEAADRSGDESARIAELEASLPALTEAEEGLVAEARRMAEARDRLDERAAAVGALRTELEVRAAGIDERRQVLRSRLDDVEARLSTHEAQRSDVEARRADLDRREAVLVALADALAQRLEALEARLGELRERRRRQSEAARSVAEELDGLRRRRGELEKRQAEVRELLHRCEVDEAENRLRLDALVERIRAELDTSPEAVLAAECPPLDEGVAPAARIRELERELKLMGPINPLALQEFDELSERHEFLQSQLDDVKSGRRELTKVIRSIDEEIVNVFAAAYADVADNFTTLFGRLFPGGEGKLRLTEPSNLLDTGIEIEAKPSGKNVKKLSLLSGGERSLTALAFLFAVFRSRPSPFYVMDEVEAALDDVNLHRFLELVAEFRDEAQLLIVSHQKRTMEAADVLYGVSMKPGGSSRVLSERADAVV